MAPFSLDLGLRNTHVAVTGGAGIIGRFVVSAFLSAGAKVTIFDTNQSSLAQFEQELKDAAENTHDLPFQVFRVDISKEKDLTDAFEAARTGLFGTIACCVALASLDLSVLPQNTSIIDTPLDQWKRTLDINVTGTFLTARTWLRQLHNAEPGLSNAGLIIVGSIAGFGGSRGNPDYATGKSAVQGGLLQSLKADVPRTYPGARVNAIAPGAVDTPRFRDECARDPSQYYSDCQATTALGKPVDIASVARSIVYLASEAWSGNVHGQILSVDSGTFGNLMWTEEEGRRMAEGLAG